MPPWSWSFARARAGAHASLPVNALASPPASPSTRANAGGPQKPRSRVASVARGAAIVALCVAAIAALYHLASPTIAEAIGDAARRQRAAAYVSEKLTVFGEAPSLLGPLEKNQTRFTTQSVSSTALPSSTLPPGVLARELRAVFLIPFLQACVATTAFLSSLVAADRMFHVYVAAYWRLCSRKDPVSARWRVRAPMPDPQTVTPDTVHLFPTVVVQLPMFNEKEVCEHVIDAACALEYPRSRILVQILDDSTCSETRRRIEHKVFYLTLVPVFEWKERGANIAYRWRSNRSGYKSGAMEEAMEDIAAYEYVAIFDADFDPEPDFLLKTVVYLRDNPAAGFAQARWVYTNGDESVLTRVQEISLNYHIRCEQYARHAADVFFNFNGTAGVWRRACIEDAGGWNHRTTVEDMDLSLRAYLRGWKFIFLDDVTCPNEIPACYDAFRKQQHRWSCGPMQLWRAATTAVWTAKDVPFAKKCYLVVFFFGTRMFATHVVSFFLYCVLIPLCATAPEVTIPFWALVYAPVLVTLSTIAFTPRGWRVAAQYVLFENAMCIVKLTAMLAGLLHWSNAHEWVVTTKLGRFVDKVKRSEVGVKAKAAAKRVAASVPEKLKRARKVYARELCMGAFFLSCGLYGVCVHAMWYYAIFLCAQGVVFLAFGLNYVDGR